MLRDHSIALSWHTRLTFASDIAHGMAYLHTHEMLHRDLKADNCFVDEKTMRVKVADFGTGLVGARMSGRDEIADRKSQRSSAASIGTSWSLSSARSHPGTPAYRNRVESFSMSTGQGSLMWMSPERLREERVTRAEAKAGDVYRYVQIIQSIHLRALNMSITQRSSFSMLCRQYLHSPECRLKTKFHNCSLVMTPIAVLFSDIVRVSSDLSVQTHYQ
jgi:serine/threonine protein kinase